MSNVFLLIKQQKWNDLKNLIENKDIDLNITDNGGNYLLHYILNYNQIDILKLMLKKNIFTNMLNVEGHSILYIPIKFNYIEIIKILLEYDSHNISFNMIDFQDKHNNIPLHYAIFFNNTDAIKLLLSYKSDISIIDNNGNNALHLCVRMKNVENVKLLLETIKNNEYFLNSQNKYGETILHIICNFQLIDILNVIIKYPINPNIKNFNYQITSLIYAIYTNNLNIVDLLLKINADPNILDYQGNSALHHCIIENNPEIFNKLINLYIDFNLTNINGQTLLHLVLLNKLKKYNLDLLIEKTSLNIQDNQGYTPLHYLCQQNLLGDYLINKKMNIYIKNIHGKTPLDYCKDKNILLDIVTKSYINILKTNKNKWPNKLDNECSNNGNNCTDKIKKYIETNHFSYPLIEKIQIIFENEKNAMFTTFTGISLDVICGILLLQNKFKKQLCKSLNNNFINNRELELYYKQISINHDYEYYNFEISWIYQTLFFPKDIINLIEKCSKKYIIIPIGIELNAGAHSNILIIENIGDHYEIERFEPDGYGFPSGFNYNPTLLDSLIQQNLDNYNIKYTYYKPKDFLPKIGFQLLENNEHIRNKKIGDPNGFCAGWSLWWAYQRMKYHKIPREKLANKLIKTIKMKNLSFKNIIRNFTIKITNYRDKILKSYGLDINDILNNKINQSDFDNINKTLIKLNI